MFLPTTSIPSLSSLTCRDKSKDKLALNDLMLNLDNILQTIMKNAGFDIDQREVYYKPFLDFMHFTLLYLSRAMHESKQRLYCEVSEDEKKCLERLESTMIEVNDMKMNAAIQLMKKEMPLIIKDFMLRAGYDESETNKSHNSYLSLMSDFITEGSEKLFRYKTRFGHSENEIASSVNRNDNIAIMQGTNMQQEKSTLTLQLITTTRKHLIYYCPTENVVIKVLNTEDPQVKDAGNLVNELKMAKSISHPSFRQSIERITFENKEALVLKWAPGIPISQVEKFTVNNFLSIAREIVSSLLAMHMKQIMHMNLSCSHIIFNPESKNVNIIGCGSAMSFSSKANYITNQELQDKDLRYMCPEQTGRNNRDVDYRCDFYSLGIVFYKLLTGKYPFENDNALELLHLQICRDPLPVHIIDPSIPVAISTMISKLLKKNADDRYQSTKGIIHDLDLMISEHSRGKSLESIELGQHDVSETLLISQKLYGHSNYFQSLLSAFDRASTSFEIVFIEGSSGTGKSALVYELYKPITQKNGILVCGKYDFSSLESYSSLLEAMNNFIDDLLLKDEPTKISYKNEILQAVGDEGKLLTDVITNLHLVIGDQPYISDAYGLEAKNRFHYVFIKFIKAICSDDCPIVLALEDLQWMDAESLSLLSKLIADKSVTGLMLVGIYRDNEVSDSHPVTRLMHHIKGAKRKSTRIKIDNMDHESINHFLSDSLSLPALETYALTALMYEKTNGNPFYLKQLLKYLYEQGKVFFSNNEWKWDNNIFCAKDLYENVKELLRLKILSFDEYTQQSIKAASCLGSSFSIRILKLIVNHNEGIKGAVSSGMIIQSKGSDTIYHFAHDNIQEAAYSLLPENPKEILLYIGKKLWKLLSKEELYENIFMVVKLITGALDLLEDQEERLQILDLYIKAGDKAMKSTAFPQAFEYYYESGMKLLGEECWDKYYDLSLNVHDKAAKSAYCISDYVQMNAILDDISKHASSSLHSVKSYSLKIKYFNDRRNFEDAVNIAVHFLELLGERIVDDRCESMTDSDVSNLRKILSETSKEKVVGKEMFNDELSAIMMILDDILYSCVYSNRQLLASISARIVNLSLIHGISEFSPKGFAVFASILSAEGNELGFHVGKLSIAILEKNKTKENIPWVYNTYFCMIAPFYISIHNVIDPLMKSFTVSIEVGSHSSCVLSGAGYFFHAFISGKPLKDLAEDVDDIVASFPATNTRCTQSIHQAIHNLIEERKKNPAVLTGQHFDNSYCFDWGEKECDKSRVTVISCIVAYIFHDYKLALELVDNCIPIQNFIRGTYFYPTFLFYDSLIRLASLQGNGINVQDKNRIVESNLTQLKKLSNSAPENYLNKCYLIEAEIAAMSNNGQAMINYEKSTELSKKHCFLHEEAISCERAALFLLRSGFTTQGNQQLKRACKCYEDWGAASKKYHLIQEYPLLKDVKELPVLCETELLLDDKSLASVSLLSDNDTFASLHSSKRAKLS